MVHQGGQATPTAARAILADEMVVAEGWAARQGGELGLLDASDEDVVLFEEVAEFGGGVAEAVAVELE